MQRQDQSVHHSQPLVLLRLLLELISWCSYISYRQSYAHHPAKKRKTVGPSANGFSTSGYESEERRGLMSAGAFEDDGDAVIEMDLLPPRWVDIQDEVTELLGTIAKKSANLEKLHQKHVLPGFDDEDVKRQEEIAIERMTQEVTRGFHDCQNAIQRIEMMVRDARHQGDVSAADETMARNIQISLAGRVQEVSAGFRKKQSNYLKSKLNKFYVQGISLTGSQNCVRWVVSHLIGLPRRPRILTLILL